MLYASIGGSTSSHPSPHKEMDEEEQEWNNWFKKYLYFKIYL